MILYWKLWYYTENYGTLIFFEKNPWYYGKNYDTKLKTETILKTMELWFTIEKIMVL